MSGVENERSISRRVGLVVYFMVMGTFFLGLPWSELWPSAASLPRWLGMLLLHPIMRGVISGFGLVLFLAALMETHGIVRKK